MRGCHLMRASIWLKTRADAFVLEAKEADKIAGLHQDNPEEKKAATTRAAAYRIVATELRSCANEFPEHLG